RASFVLPTAGGAWMTLSANSSDWPEISPDSRVIVAGDLGENVVSIDGAPPRPLLRPDGTPASAPSFEPAGGPDKAIFYDHDDSWLANADRSGDWVRDVNQSC